MNNTDDIKDNVEQEPKGKQVPDITTEKTNKNDVQSKPSVKKPIYKKWWFWVLIVFGVLILAGIGSASNSNTSQNSDNGDNKNSQSNSTNETKTQEDNTSSSEPDGTPSSENAGGYKVGETIVFKDSKVTVTNVTRNASTGNEFVTPESGKEYVKIDVSFVNTTTSKKSFYTNDWKLQDSDGVIRDISFTATSMLDNGFTSSVDLAGSGKWSGSMMFEVPAGDTNLQLQYKPSLFSDTTVINLQ